jgi:hypothetical protein
MSGATQSLLVVVGRESESQDSLRKAVILARHLGAQVDVFLCESEPATAASEASAHRILDALRGSITADDVRIATGWAGGTSLWDGIAGRMALRRTCLVLRSIAGAAASGRARATGAERELMRRCAVPLWLARRAAWAPRPRFAVDSASADCASTAAWIRSAMHLAETVARGCRADIELAKGADAGAIDALFVPSSGAGDGAAVARAEGLFQQVDCDLVLVPPAGADGAAPSWVSLDRVARAVSS